MKNKSISSENSVLPFSEGNRGDAAVSTADSDSPITRGVGRYIWQLFPRLLRNNFNKVLLVDDDPSIHIAINEYLTSAGYEVQHAISEFDAMQIIKDNLPDFLLIDWEKPTISGLQVYESLRRTFKDRYLYIIVLTSEDMVRDKVQMISAGADAYMVKPFPPGELLSQLQAGTRIIEQHLRLKELALQDPLTGLLDRRIFTELANEEWNRSGLYNYPLSCAMIDIDYFKILNENHGHMHGDRILTRIAEILKESCRECDVFSRYSGDEFCALLTNTDLQGSLVCAERFRATVEKERRLAPALDAFPTVTVGIASRTPTTTVSRAMFDKADQALLWGKLISRNVVTYFDEAAASFVAYPKTND